MNDDPGHKAAEEILQQKRDDSYGDRTGIPRVPAIADWTHCTTCCVRRDHVYDSEMKAWRCGFCGVVNTSMTERRKAITAVAEKHLKKNPEVTIIEDPPKGWSPCQYEIDGSYCPVCKKGEE
jgi:hypothetical protein